MDREITTADMYPIDILEGIAADCEWLHTRADDYNLVIEREMKHGTYGMHVRDEEDEVRFIAQKPFDCPGYAELELLRLLVLINYTVRPGSFGYNQEIKKITYCTSLDFSDERPLSAEIIEIRVNAMLAVLDAAHYCFQAIAGQIMPLQKNVTNNSLTTCLNPGLSAKDALNLFAGEGVGRG